MKYFIFKYILIFSLVLNVLNAYAEGNPAEVLNSKIEAAKEVVKPISPDKVMNWIRSKRSFTLIDVREKEEVLAGKIESKNYMNLSRGLLDISASKGALDTDKLIVVYCKTGSRGLLAANTLQELGFTNVYNLEGGIQAWMESGLPITNSIGTFKAVPYDMTGCAENN